jgi:hypothetical protein
MNERVALPPIEPVTMKAQLQRRLNAREVLLVVLQMLIGAGVGATAMIMLLKGGAQLAPSGTNAGLVALVAAPAALVAIIVQMLVHELGHALVGQGMGGTILRVIIGPWRWERFRSGLRFTRVRALKGIGGLAQNVLPDGPDFRRAFVAMLLGGPLANLALAGMAWMLLPVLPVWPLKVFAAALVAMGLLFGLINLLPFRSGGFQTDGLQLMRAFTDPEALSMRQRAMRIARASLDGLRPREFDPGDLAALDVDRSEGMEKLGVQMIHAVVACDRGDYARMRELLNPALADWQKLPDGLRQSLAAMAALLAIELDREPAAAREWLLRTDAGLVHSFELDWVRARIAELERSTAERDAALERVRTALDDTIYLGEERVYREKMEAFSSARVTAPL